MSTGKKAFVNGCQELTDIDRECLFEHVTEIINTIKFVLPFVLSY